MLISEDAPPRGWVGEVTNNALAYFDVIAGRLEHKAEDARAYIPQIPEHDRPRVEQSWKDAAASYSEAAVTLKRMVGEWRKDNALGTLLADINEVAIDRDCGVPGHAEQVQSAPRKTWVKAG